MEVKTYEINKIQIVDRQVDGCIDGNERQMSVQTDEQKKQTDVRTYRKRD